MDFTEIYRDLEGVLSQASQVGLRCPPGCGACCRKPTQNIEASVAEMVPVAQHLWETGQAEVFFARGRTAGAEGVCVLHQPGGDRPLPLGRCLFYEYRPLTCRLFGVGGFRDKSGQVQLGWSRVMLAQVPDLRQRVEEAQKAGWQPPVAAAWRLRMAEVDPRAATDLEPLNLALVRALEFVGLRRRYHSDESPTSFDP